METTNKTISQDENLKEMDLLIHTRFIQLLMVRTRKKISDDLLDSSFREFAYTLHAILGTGTGQLPHLYRLANYTIAQLNVLKAEIMHIGPGEKHSH